MTGFHVAHGAEHGGLQPGDARFQGTNHFLHLLAPALQAFVQIMPGKDGLVHISELSEERVAKTSDVVKEGDKVTVKLVAVDDRGRLQLSMKAAKRELEDKKD